MMITLSTQEAVLESDIIRDYHSDFIAFCTTMMMSDPIYSGNNNVVGITITIFWGKTLGEIQSFFFGKL